MKSKIKIFTKLKPKRRTEFPVCVASPLEVGNMTEWQSNPLIDSLSVFLKV